MVPELWRIWAGAMTREQHKALAALLGGHGILSPEGGAYKGPPDGVALWAVAAAHHGRAALQCDRCGGSGSTPLPGYRYAGANIRCPACGGVGWGTE